MNKPRILALISIISTLCFRSHAQGTIPVNSLFQNDSIKYGLILVTPTALSYKKPEKVGTFVVLHCSKHIRDSLLNLDSAFWIDHLKNDTSDWATNLVLYYLYEKDATSIEIVFDSRGKWLTIKNREIEYWKNRLKNKKHS